jgi:hypothetical protein
MLTHNPTEFGAIPLAPQQHPESHRALFRSRPHRSLAYKTSNLLRSSRHQKHRSIVLPVDYTTGKPAFQRGIGPSPDRSYLSWPRRRRRKAFRGRHGGRRLNNRQITNVTNSGEHQILPYLYDSIRSAKFGCPFARTSIISTSVTGGILLGGCDRKGFL